MRLVATTQTMGDADYAEQGYAEGSLIGLHFMVRDQDGDLCLFKVMALSAGCIVGKPCNDDGTTHDGTHVIVRASSVWQGKMWSDACAATEEAASIIHAQENADSDVLEALRAYIKDEDRPIAFHRSNDVGLRLLPYLPREYSPDDIRESAVRLLEDRKIFIGTKKGAKSEVESLELAHRV